MKKNNYTSFFQNETKESRDTFVAGNVVETWNGAGTSHHLKSYARSANIRYILSLMSRMISNCQKHWKNILNYMRKRGHKMKLYFYILDMERKTGKWNLRLEECEDYVKEDAE